MNVTVSAQQAEAILKKAITAVTDEGWEPKSKQSELISSVILGSHKTYRYVLLNGILAKATNEECNPIVLQAGSKLSGSFDARSLCHEVVVPIERELLGGRLGESNEPFLNKPARYTELSTANAVRRGKDSILLNNSINVLTSLNTADEAFLSLKDCIYWVFQRESRNIIDYLQGKEGDDFQQSSMVYFARDLIQQSHEGETCAVISGVSFSLLGLFANRNFEVKTHKVNQAGSSSKEVSDIDVYEDGILIYTAEVKDKHFTSQDVEHAVNKAAMAGHGSLIFLKGPQGILQGDTELKLGLEWKAKGFDLYFENVLEHFISIASISQIQDSITFMQIINHHADSAKVKDLTFSHIATCAKKQNW